MNEPTRSTTRANLLGAVLLALLVTPSCVAQPDYDDHSLLAGTQRVLALDFGRGVTGPRVTRLKRFPKALDTELKRARDMLEIGTQPVATMAGGELERTRSLSARAMDGVAAEAKRRPEMPAGIVPTSFEFSRNTANNLDAGIRFFGFHKQPMVELSDKQHRTDHRDVRPEATLWQRFRRRWPFF